MVTSLTPQQKSPSTDSAMLPPMPSALLRKAQTVIYFLLVVSPVLFLPAVLLPNPFDTPRRLLLLLGAGILIALILYSWALRGGIIVRRHALDLPVLLFIIACLLTSATSEYPSLSLSGPLWSKDGLPFIGMAVLLYYGIKEFLRTPDEIHHAIRLMVVTGGLVAIVGYLDYVGLVAYGLSSSGNRLYGSMMLPMYTGTYLAMLIPLAASMLMITADQRWQRILTASLVLMLPALVFTQTRAAWLGLAITVVMLSLLIRSLCHQNKSFPLPSVRLVIIVLILSIGLGIGIEVIHSTTTLRKSNISNRMASMLNTDEDSSVQTRYLLMRGAWNAFLVRPLQGWGPGTSQYVLLQYRPAGNGKNTNSLINRSFGLGTPHSVQLQIAMEMGLIGFLTYAFVIIVLFRSCLHLFRAHNENQWTAIGLIGFFAAYQLSSLFNIDNAATLSTFWIGVGLLAAFTAQERSFSLLPLPSPVCSTIRLASIILLFLVTTSVIMQGAAGYYLFRGIGKIAKIETLSQQKKLIEAQALTIPAIADFMRTIMLTPILTFDGKRLAVQYGDDASFSYLTLAYCQRARVCTDQVNVLGARSQMIHAGKRALELLDRDMAREYLVSEHIRFEKYDEARALMPDFLRFMPHSADVRLMNAQILAKTGDLYAALREAAYAHKLDPSYGTAQFALAHYQAQLILQGEELQPNLIPQACENYRKAQEMGESFPPKAQAEYAAILFLDGKLPDAIKVGRTLRGTPEFDTLLDTIRRMAIRYQREDDAKVMQRSLQ